MQYFLNFNIIFNKFKKEVNYYKELRHFIGTKE